VKVVRPASISREAEVPCEWKEKYLAIQLKSFAPLSQIYIEIQIAGRVQSKGRIYRKTWTIFEKGR